MPANSVMLLEPYDYCSIMHYSPTTFSTDPLKHTFEPRHHVDCEIGQRDYLTEKDIKRIQKLYNCGMHGMYCKHFDSDKIRCRNIDILN